VNSTTERRFSSALGCATGGAKSFRGHDGAVDSPEMTHDEIKLADRTCAEPEIIGRRRRDRQAGPSIASRWWTAGCLTTKRDAMVARMVCPTPTGTATRINPVSSLRSFSQRIERGFPIAPTSRGHPPEKWLPESVSVSSLCRAPHELCAEQLLELF